MLVDQLLREGSRTLCPTPTHSLATKAAAGQGRLSVGMESFALGAQEDPASAQRGKCNKGAFTGGLGSPVRLSLSAGGDSLVLEGLQQITADGGCWCFWEQKKDNKGGMFCPVLLPPHGGCLMGKAAVGPVCKWDVKGVETPETLLPQPVPSSFLGFINSHLAALQALCTGVSPFSAGCGTGFGSSVGSAQGHAEAALDQTILLITTLIPAALFTCSVIICLIKPCCSY